MNKKVFSVLLVLMLGIGMVQAQGISIGVSGGVNLFTGDISKTPSTPQDILDRGVTGYTAEPAFGIKAKMGLPLLPISIAAEANYTKMSGSVEFSGLKYETSSTMWTFSAGAELSLFPGPLSPYLAADILYNNFGETTTKITGMADQKTTGKSGVGFGIGVGIEFTLLPMIDLDVSAKYNLNGKDAFGNNANTMMILGHLMF